MANTSATGGFLLPTNTASAPLEGAALFDYLQAWIVGITGMAGTNVRPRWQQEPGNLPITGIDWIAFGITQRESQVFASEQHFDDANGIYNEVRNHEVLSILLSFYGQNADNYASIMREGISLAQNREYLSSQNMGVVDWGDAMATPELIKEQWLYRVDLVIRVRRQIVRDYAILDIASAQVDINNELYTTVVTAQ